MGSTKSDGVLGSPLVVLAIAAAAVAGIYGPDPLKPLYEWAHAHGGLHNALAALLSRLGWTF